MGSNRRARHILTRGKSRLLRSDSGDAVVEATILFPVMTMIFAALVLVAVYLPAQAVLQQSTQYAATALSTEMSDTWLSYDVLAMEYYLAPNKDALTNVYVKIFEPSSVIIGIKAEFITRLRESRSVSSKAGDLTVLCSFNNKFIYSEIIVAATREYPMPVDLSLIGFPKTMTVTATSVAVVQNGDEFVRNMDLAVDFAGFIAKKFGLEDVGKSIGDFGKEVKNMLGW